MADEGANAESQQDDGTEKKGLLSALEAEREKRHAAEKRAAQIEGQLAGLSTATAKPAKETPKDLSAAELRQAVDEGKITDAEADQIRENQIERRVMAKAEARIDGSLNTATTANRVDDELGRYRKAVPDIDKEDSAARQKLEGEFTYLVSLGEDRNDPRTDLLAARAAFGDITKLESVNGPKPRETHGETGGHAEPGEGGESRDGWPKDMPAGQRKYYEDQVNRGALADRKAAVAEWNYKPKHGPRRAA